MNKKYIVRLSDEERGVCQDVVKRLKGTSEKVKRAQILLKADGCRSRSRCGTLCTSVCAHRHLSQRLSIGLPSHGPLTFIHPAHDGPRARVVDGSTSVRPSGLPGSHEPY